MANIVARILEKRIGKLFSNFHAGKNASSSLFKGEGTAVDLEFNKSFINGFLPLNFAVTRATCKLLKWRLSLVSKTPISLVLSGVHIELQVLPPGQTRSVWTKQKKKRSKKDKESKSKKQAILQGIKLQFQDVEFKVLLLAGHGATSARDLPFIRLEVAQIRLHSANSQWHEVSDLSKVYAINPSVGEAMSFKKLEISGCTLSVYHPAANLSQSTHGAATADAAVLLDYVSLHAKLSTKRRATDWELLAFKLDFEMPEVTCAMSRNEVFMLKMLAEALRTAKEDTKAAAAAARDTGGGGAGGMIRSGSTVSLEVEEEEGEADEREREEEEAQGLDSILELSAEFVTEEADAQQWCRYATIPKP
jgi:hypothetical protein